MRAAIYIAVFAGLVVLASAACPNSCSGHGTCGANDKCACYAQTNTPWGQRKGYTGADCSRRTCPLGISSSSISTQRNALRQILFTPVDGDYVTANRNNLQVYLDDDFDSAMDLNFLVRVADTVAGTYQYKLDTDTYYSQPIDMAYWRMGARELTNGTGIRVFWTNKGNEALVQNGDLYEFTAYHNNGVDFNSIDDNSAHQMQECSGAGLCDMETGRCGCFDGFTGEACQRTVCPNACSGHGMCQLESRFATDAGTTYGSAYDADKLVGCKCDNGFRGASCDQIECPSGADPLLFDGGAQGRDCSGRGICNYGTGQCECFKGFNGERCETQNNFA